MQPTTARRASAQISPGKLARAHTSLEGSAQCNQCHSKRSEEMDAKCLACHTGIASLREQNRGFHARVGNAPCATCHPDHAGVDFELIHWDNGSPEAYDHAQAGWKLEGKHAGLACGDCHRAKFQNQDFMRSVRREHPEKSWLGLTPECRTCHEDPHRGDLGQNCTSCHGNAAWKPAERFDHASTAFPLLGKHQNVACATCHRGGDPQVTPASLPRYKPLAHAECANCHADVHKGKFGPKCSSCHVVEGFKQIRTDAFDHDLTRYPLRGRHAGLDCATCHDPQKAWGKQPPFATCAGCHQDPHAGKATLASAVVDCASCHTVSGFKESTFDPERHADTRFPLIGKHMKTECVGCHPKSEDGATWGAAAVVLRPAYDACSSCHRSPHGSQPVTSTVCESCHNEQGFVPSTFAVDRHAVTALPLDGRHAGGTCASCHGPVRPGLPAVPDSATVGVAGFWFEPDSRCEACHLDPHAGRFLTRDPEGGSACKDCHDTDRFVPSGIGPREHLYYPLDGAHAAVPCVLCHSELSFPASEATLVGNGRVTSLPFGLKRSACKDCHQDPHAGQFASRVSGDDCRSCHGTAAFVPAVHFDHTRDAAFSTDGAHARVPCASCHKPQEINGVSVMIYRPVDTRCSSCHGDKN